MQRLLDFFVVFFNRYDITTELIMLFTLMILKIIVHSSKPEKTLMFKIFQIGMRFATLIIVFHIFMLGETIRIKNDNFLIFNIEYIIFSLSYTGVLECLFIYQLLLSYKRRFQKKRILTFSFILGVIWLGILMFPLFRGVLLDFSDGKYKMSKNSDIYVLDSYICIMVVAIVSLFNKKDVSRIVNVMTAIFVPIEAIAISAQLFLHSDYLVCTTYTLPFFIYFLLFHVNRYDEVTGCQGFTAYKSFLNQCLKSNKKFILLTVTCPAIEARNNIELEKKVIGICNNLTRKIEKIDSKIRVYHISTFHYKVIKVVENEREGEIIKMNLIDLLSEPIFLEDRYIKIPMNFLVSKRYEMIDTCEEYNILLKKMNNEFWNLGIDQTIEISDEDVKAFKRRMFLEKNIIEIKFNHNIDDERVCLYVQPIFNVNTGTFQTGESLIRLNINGEFFYPDEFIPIAEQCGCIHALTRIMLFKVAKLAVKLRENPGFKALSLNVSTVEMIEPNVCEEFFGIINRAGAKPENIRIEITESTKVLEYKRVIQNINDFVGMGLKFYLDDFGTGYSNLDRVIALPFSAIKFDKNLMYKAFEDSKTDQIFRFLASFFKQKGYMLVVEGVENENQLEYVKSIGFDYIQGFFYSKPISSEEVEKFYISKSMQDRIAVNGRTLESAIATCSGCLA